MESLRKSRDGGLLTLTLDRPAKRNALDLGLVLALCDALEAAGRDEGVRAVLLAGSGDAFCAGGDFDAMLERRGDALATKDAQEHGFARLARAILHLEKPVVACAHGHAFGAGLMLVLASDFAVAAPTARFAASFTKVGLVPDMSGTWLLPKTLGLRAAREMALTAEPVDAARALQLGLVNEVHADAHARALEVALGFAAGPTRALGLAKKAIVLGMVDTLDGALAREANFQAFCFTTKDHAEGVDAFREKRPPRFTGQ